MRRSPLLLVVAFACWHPGPALTVAPLAALTSPVGSFTSEPVVVRLGGQPTVAFTAQATRPFGVSAGILGQPTLITFAPTSAGDAHGTVTIRSGDQEVEVPVVGHTSMCQQDAECAQVDVCFPSSCLSGRCVQHPPSCPLPSTVCQQPTCAHPAGCGFVPVHDGVDCSAELGLGASCEGGVCQPPSVPLCVDPSLPDMPLVWSKSFSRIVSLATTDDGIYLSDDTVVVALDADGQVVWTVSLPVENPPLLWPWLVVVDGVVMAGNSKDLIGYDAQTGALLWHDDLNSLGTVGPAMGIPIGASDTEVFTFVSEGTDRIDVRTGALVGQATTPPHETGGGAFDTYGDGTGHLIYGGQSTTEVASPGDSLPVLFSGLLMGVTATGVWGLSPASALTQWSFDGSVAASVSGDIGVSPFVVGTDVGYIVGKPGPALFSAVLGFPAAGGPSQPICTLGEGINYSLLLTSRGSLLILASFFDSHSGIDAIVDVTSDGADQAHPFTPPSFVDDANMRLVGIVGGRAIVENIGTFELQAFQLIPNTAVAAHGWVSINGSPANGDAPR